MTIKEKLVVLNATIPSSLKRFAEKASKKGEFSSTSDYIRHLIRADQKKESRDDIEAVIASIMSYLFKDIAKEKNVIDSAHGIKILKNKLMTIASLFEMALDLRKVKIKKDTPDISEDELIKKLNAWSISSDTSEEVPGFIETSEDRRQKLNV